MKVLYYTPSCFLDQALSFAPALGRRVKLHLVVELAPESWNANLLASSPDGLRPGLQSVSRLLGRDLSVEVLRDLSELAGFSALVFVHKRALDPRSMLTGLLGLWGPAHRDRPDVVHLNGVPFRLAPSLPFLRAVPLVVSVHDPIPHSGDVSLKAELSHRIAVRQADQVIIHNEAQRAEFCQLRGLDRRKVHSVPLGPYEVYRRWPRTAGGSRSHRLRVLLFGRLSPYKGLDDFVAIARRAAVRLHGVDFVAEGSSPDERVVSREEVLANECRLIVTCRHVPTAELVTLVDNADLVVLPYRDATQSGVLLTAQALGKPAVVTDAGGLPEYISDGETGVVVAAGDLGALADAVVAVVGEERFRARLIGGVRRFVEEKRPWEAIAESTVGIYSEAVVRRTSRAAAR